jgi:orotidine-5'-phosphate decarboxylase
MSEPYLVRLARRTAKAGTVLCVGIDPTPELLPPAWPDGLRGIERLARLLVEAAAPHAAAIKPNLAFFEAYGGAGITALERVLAARPPGVLVVADAKRGDVETTVARQAAALFDALGADAVTVSPYLGLSALTAFLARADRFAYVLCRTSNPGAGELQDLVVGPDPSIDAPAEALHKRVARRVAASGLGDRAGLVVGATAPAELVALRAVVPGLAFLVPGVGAQGGQAAPVLAAGPATDAPAGTRPGGGLLVNVSRGIAAAAARRSSDADSADPGERVAAAARQWAATLAVLS